MDHYQTFKILAAILFYGGLALVVVGLNIYRKDVTATGSLFVASGFATWFWNGLSWYANN